MKFSFLFLLFLSFYFLSSSSIQLNVYPSNFNNKKSFNILKSLFSNQNDTIDSFSTSSSSLFSTTGLNFPSHIKLNNLNLTDESKEIDVNFFYHLNETSQLNQPDLSIIYLDEENLLNQANCLSIFSDAIQPHYNRLIHQYISSSISPSASNITTPSFLILFSGKPTSIKKIEPLFKYAILQQLPSDLINFALDSTFPAKLAQFLKIQIILVSSGPPLPSYSFSPSLIHNFLNNSIEFNKKNDINIKNYYQNNDKNYNYKNYLKNIKFFNFFPSFLSFSSSILSTNLYTYTQYEEIINDFQNSLINYSNMLENTKSTILSPYSSSSLSSISSLSTSPSLSSPSSLLLSKEKDLLSNISSFELGNYLKESINKTLLKNKKLNKKINKKLLYFYIYNSISVLYKNYLKIIKNNVINLFNQIILGISLSNDDENSKDLEEKEPKSSSTSSSYLPSLSPFFSTPFDSLVTTTEIEYDYYKIKEFILSYYDNEINNLISKKELKKFLLTHTDLLRNDIEELIDNYIKTKINYLIINKILSNKNLRLPYDINFHILFNKPFHNFIKDYHQDVLTEDQYDKFVYNPTNKINLNNQNINENLLDTYNKLNYFINIVENNKDIKKDIGSSDLKRLKKLRDEYKENLSFSNSIFNKSLMKNNQNIQNQLKNEENSIENYDFSTISSTLKNNPERFLRWDIPALSKVNENLSKIKMKKSSKNGFFSRFLPAKYIHPPINHDSI